MFAHAPSAHAAPLTPEVFKACAERHSASLQRFLLRHVGDRELARDLVQESLMRLWMKREQVDAGKARSYLFTTGIHALVSHMRRTRWAVRLGPEHDPACSGRPAEPDLHAHLEAGLRRLPEAQRRVLTLRHLQGHSYDEIAAMTGLNPVQVKVYLHRGRKAMRAYLGRPELLV